MSLSSLKATNVKVTTYNVLSSHLGGPDYFTSCKPEWLDPSYRLRKLESRLDAETQDGAIICLQEVSTPWAGQLHSYFASKNYYFVSGLYGGKFNGYMGVGVAIPMSKYSIEDVDITRVSDTKRFARPARLPPLIQAWRSYVVEPVLKFLRLVSILKPLPENPWQLASSRSNQMVSVRLRDKEADQTFVVGTYHMPCMFKLPSVMLIHCALSAQHIQRFSRNDPYIFCGDFNIKPQDSMYKLLTSGAIESENADVPTLEDGDNYKFQLSEPLRSAYKEASSSGIEPEFTNWSKVKEDPEFIDTLDYIFLSKQWSLTGVAALPTRAQVPGPLPTEHEPSDHLLLSASLSLATTTTAAV